MIFKIFSNFLVIIKQKKSTPEGVLLLKGDIMTRTIILLLTSVRHRSC